MDVNRRVLSSWLVAVNVIVASGVSLAAEEPRTASVLYFANTAKVNEYDWLGIGLADMLAGDLASGGGLRLVERENLEKVLREQEFALSSLADPGTAPRVGHLLSARLIVYGSFLIAGSPGQESLRVDAKVVDAETAGVVATASAEGPESELLSIARDLSSRLAAALGIRIGSPDRAANPDSARAYYQGLESLDAGDLAAAIRSFGEASRLDPIFQKPGEGLEAAYRFLKDFRSQRYRREMNALVADIGAIVHRIVAPVFYSFADAVRDPTAYGFSDVAAVSAAFQSRPVVWLGDTPVQAIWHLQNQYATLGHMAEDFFGDQEFKYRCGDEILSWADAAEKAYPRDPFLVEIVYQRLLVFLDRKNWAAVKDVCERLMTEYPNYRMMWAVEDSYARALGELK